MSGPCALPPVRGRIRKDAVLARTSWLRVGGPAEFLFTPADEEDLCSFLAGLSLEVPVTVVGRASNLLVRDGGVDGVVIRLGRAFADVRVDGESVETGAAVADTDVARVAGEAGLAGFAFLDGIPGSIGGAVSMNAGCHGSDTSRVLERVRAVDRAGRVHEAEAADLGMRYRGTDAPADWIFVSARFRGVPGDRGAIRRCMESFREERGGNQPQGVATGGSTFRNPPGGEAWRLIERAGCRGLRRGGARVSEKHANFLVNEGGATADDLERLAEEVRRRVLEDSGVDLEWEIRRIGRPAGEAAR